MQAGNDLDELIIEKVMGCKREGDKWRLQKIGEGSLIAHVPPFSTDISCAWSIVQKFDGQWTIDGQHHIGWEVSFVEASMREDRLETPFVATAETAPHAICLAALKAVGYSPPAKGS